MNIPRIPVLIVIVFAVAVLAFPGQKVETVDGVRVVHNSGPGAWGRAPKVTLEPAGVLGDVDTADENLAFHIPMNIVLDAAGNRYVLDSGNHRIQKFGPDGRHSATFGRQGQGPGEFVYPSWLSLDDRGFLYVSDPNNNRVQVLTPDGKDHKTIRFTEGTGGDVFWTRPGELLMGLPRLRIRFSPDEANKSAELPKLLKVIDESAKVLREFGEPRDFADDMVNSTANEIIVTIDGAGAACAVFPRQNRIDRFAADGRLLWRADRELPYDMEVKEKGSVDRTGGNMRVQMPRMNRSSSGVAVDGKGRVWVATLTRQLKKEEEVNLGISMMSTSGGGRTVGYSVHGDTDVRTTDAYKLEVFDAEGALLGSLPLDFFVDGVFIYGDRLFLLDKFRGAQFREYRIKG
jgi:sugar lactone lactonase YvrE